MFDSAAPLPHEPEAFTPPGFSVEVTATRQGVVTVFFDPGKPSHPRPLRDIARAQEWALRFAPL